MKNISLIFALIFLISCSTQDDNIPIQGDENIEEAINKYTRYNNLDPIHRAITVTKGCNTKIATYYIEDIKVNPRLLLDTPSKYDITSDYLILFYENETVKNKYIFDEIDSLIISKNIRLDDELKTTHCPPLWKVEQKGERLIIYQDYNMSDNEMNYGCL